MALYCDRDNAAHIASWHPAVALAVADVLDADEIFLTGNFSKVLPVVKVEDHEYQQGQFANLANKLYFEFAACEGQKGFDRGG